MPKNIFESLLATPRLYGPKVSPDCKWVAWVWANVGPNADVYVAPTDGGAAPRRLTDFGEDTAVVSWTEDSSSVVVHHDYDGDERFRLYKVDVISGEVLPLSDAHPQAFIRGGSITRDGKYLIFAANHDIETGKETEFTFVYRQDLQSGEKLRLTSPERPAFVWPVVNGQGTYIIYPRNDRHPKGEQIWMVDIEGKNDREILNFGDTAKVSASWHPNGEEVLFICEAEGYRRVGMYNTIEGTIRWLIDDSTRNIEDAYVPFGTELVAIIEIKNAVSTTTLLDPTSGEEVVCSQKQTLVPLARLSSGEWISKYYNSAQPADLVVSDAATIKRSITGVFEKVDYTPQDLVRAVHYTWQSVDGLPIQGWLYRPVGTARGTIVMVHGGPTGHSEDAWDMDIQYFVSEGFTVLDPNYRGSTGFGLAYQEAIKETGWGGKEQDDILEGIKSLIKDGIAKEGAVGITGTSYGGYSAWFAITRFPTKYVAAAIPICGMTDLVVDYETTRPDLRGYSEEMMGGTPEMVPERYHNGSPIHYIQNIKGKLLIVQGAKDPNVTPENVHAVEAVLKKEGIPYETLIFADEGHGIAKPENQKVLLARSVAFFSAAFSS